MQLNTFTHTRAHAIYIWWTNLCVSCHVVMKEKALWQPEPASARLRLRREAPLTTRALAFNDFVLPAVVSASMRWGARKPWPRYVAACCSCFPPALVPATPCHALTDH